MATNPIIGSNNKATRITIILPVDANGDWAFDELGKPVKGRTPVEFTVPRFDCMARDDFKQINDRLAELDDAKSNDGEPLSSQERGVEMVLTMIRPFVDDDVYKVVSGLKLFELEQIADRINTASTVTVGELLASTSS